MQNLEPQRTQRNTEEARDLENPFTTEAQRNTEEQASCLLYAAIYQILPDSRKICHRSRGRLRSTKISLVGGGDYFLLKLAMLSAFSFSAISLKASTISSGWSRWIQWALLAAMRCRPCSEWAAMAWCSAMRTGGWCAP